MSGGKSILSDLGGYVDRVAQLVRLDAALLSVETKANLESAAVSLGLLLAGLAAGLLGVIVLVFAAVFRLVELGLAPSLSALLVAIVLLVVCGLLLLVGVERLKRWSLAPRRTLAQFTRNLQALRASLHDEANG